MNYKGWTICDDWNWHGQKDYWIEGPQGQHIAVGGIRDGKRLIDQMGDDLKEYDTGAGPEYQPEWPM